MYLSIHPAASSIQAQHLCVKSGTKELDLDFLKCLRFVFLWIFCMIDYFTVLLDTFPKAFHPKRRRENQNVVPHLWFQQSESPKDRRRKSASLHTLQYMGTNDDDNTMVNIDFKLCNRKKGEFKFFLKKLQKKIVIYDSKFCRGDEDHLMRLCIPESKK